VTSVRRDRISTWSHLGLISPLKDRRHSPVRFLSLVLTVAPSHSENHDPQNDHRQAKPQSLIHTMEKSLFELLHFELSAQSYSSNTKPGPSLISIAFASHVNPAAWKAHRMNRRNHTPHHPVASPALPRHSPALHHILAGEVIPDHWFAVQTGEGCMDKRPEQSSVEGVGQHIPRRFQRHAMSAQLQLMDESRICNGMKAASRKQ
jgi:hypothetical protein